MIDRGRVIDCLEKLSNDYEERSRTAADEEKSHEYSDISFILWDAVKLLTEEAETYPKFDGKRWTCEKCGGPWADILDALNFAYCPGCGRKIERWY